eukprot:scaffold13246_cov147-Skeletonema_dohrnii-CCMP3373.AAC.1
MAVDISLQDIPHICFDAIASVGGATSAHAPSIQIKRTFRHLSESLEGLSTSARLRSPIMTEAFLGTPSCGTHQS